MDARKKLQEIAAKDLGGKPEDYEVARHIMNSDEWANRYSDHPMFYERSFNKPIGKVCLSLKEARHFFGHLTSRA